RGAGSRNGIWNAGGGVIGNRNTGIRSDNPQDTGVNKGYAFVGRNANLPGEPIYVLESPQFVVDRLGDINFDYYLRSATTRLQVHCSILCIGCNSKTFSCVSTTSLRVFGRQTTCAMIRNVNGHQPECLYPQ
ncbi:MAG: hypothetical protein CUN54_10290, partial [Phototrophicales bacterium]